MGLFSKIELFGFADFYHRWADSGLTMDEMLQNYQRYQNKPRDIHEPIKPPKGVVERRQRVKPPGERLTRLAAAASDLKDVNVSEVNGRVRTRELVTVRQWVAYVGMSMGFEPPDFVAILGWERSGVYHKARKALQYSTTERDYRRDLNYLLEAFGCDPVNEYI